MSSRRSSSETLAIPTAVPHASCTSSDFPYNTSAWPHLVGLGWCQRQTPSAASLCPDPRSPPHFRPQVDACADPDVVRAVAGRREATVCISGLTGEGLPDLLERISAKLADSMVGVHVLIPYAQARLCCAGTPFSRRAVGVVCANCHT